MKFWILKENIIKIKVSWVVTPYSLVLLYVLYNFTFNKRLS